MGLHTRLVLIVLVFFLGGILVGALSCRDMYGATYKGDIALTKTVPIAVKADLESYERVLKKADLGECAELEDEEYSICIDIVTDADITGAEL